MLPVDLRKADITIIEAASLFILLKKLIGLGVEPELRESWIRMCRTVPEGDFSRSQVIQAASKLVRLEQEGLSYEQTLESLTTSSVELKTLEAEIRQLTPSENKADELHNLAHFLANVADAWNEANQEQRNKLARCLFQEVWIKDKEVVAVKPRPELKPFFDLNYGVMEERLSQNFGKWRPRRDLNPRSPA